MASGHRQPRINRSSPPGIHRWISAVSQADAPVLGNLPFVGARSSNQSRFRSVPGSDAPDLPAGEPERGELAPTAILGILGGFAMLIAIATAGLVPDSTPASQLQDYVNNTVVFTEYGWAFAFFGLLGIPFVVALGRLLRRKNGVVASIATVLWALGIFLLAFTANFYTSALAAIDAASGSAPTMADATYQAAVVNNLVVYPTEFGWIAFGTGFFLMGWLARGSKILPNWLGTVGLIGGVGSAPIGPLPDFVGNFAFAIWGFAIAVLLIRRLPVSSVRVGVVLVIIGLPYFTPAGANFLPLYPVFSNTPWSFFFLISGAVLIWLGRRTRAGVRERTDPQSRRG